VNHLEEIKSILRDISAKAPTMDRLEREIAREKAIEALDGKVKAPARLVDAALKVESDDGHRSGGQGRSVVFDDPVPWPEPVIGVKVLDSLAKTFAAYVSLPRGAATALALWVVVAHAFENFFILPLLAITSPEKRCGKSRLLTLLLHLVPRPLLASNITPAALFRAIEAMRPTLLIDEADSFMKASDELRGVINAGHTRATASVVRTVGEDHEPKVFNVFGPKAVALIGRLPDTIEDRSIKVPMKRRAPGEHLERFREDRVDHLEDLRRQAARFAADHEEDLSAADPSTPTELNDRARDNWRSLLAVADLAGGSWPEKARQAALLLSGHGDDDQESVRVQLLADIQAALEDRPDPRIFTTDLLAILHEVEDRPWGEWRQGRAITGHGLARLLKPFGIRPKLLRIGAENGRGYELADFDDAFARYLPSAQDPPSGVLHPLQANNDGPSSGDPKCYDEDARNTSEIGDDARGDCDVTGVTVQNRELWGDVE